MLRKSPQKLDLTPMVDVTFLILIFFMVTASFAVRRAIEFPRAAQNIPSRNPQPFDPPQHPVRVQVDQFGSFFVLTEDSQKELLGKQSLVSELRSVRESFSAETPLRIEVESLAKLRFLVDAIDAAAIAGFARPALTETNSDLI